MNTNHEPQSAGRARAHLSASEIARCLVEGPAPEAQVHLLACFRCQAALAEAREPLAAFRDALVAWSESRSARQAALLPVGAPVFNPGRERRRSIRLWLPAASFALAALLVLGFAAGPAWFRGSLPDPSPANGSSTARVSDSALMDQVDSEVSEAVPDAMAPLTDLVAWDASERSASTILPAEKTAEKHAARRKPIGKAQVRATD